SRLRARALPERSCAIIFAFVPAFADFPALVSMKFFWQLFPRRPLSGNSAILFRRRACAARHRAATIQKAKANRRGDGGIRLRRQRPIRLPIFPANLFQHRRIFRAENWSRAVRQFVFAIRKVFAAARRANGNGPANFFVRWKPMRRIFPATRLLRNSIRVCRRRKNSNANSATKLNSEEAADRK